MRAVRRHLTIQPIQPLAVFFSFSHRLDEFFILKRQIFFFLFSQPERSGWRDAMVSLAVVPNFVFQSRFISSHCGAQNNRVLFKKKKRKRNFTAFFFFSYLLFFFFFLLLSSVLVRTVVRLPRRGGFFGGVHLSLCCNWRGALRVQKKNLFCSSRTTYTHTTYIHVHAQIYIDIYSDLLAHRDR